MKNKQILISSPQLGLSPNSHLGGEVYDYEIVKNLCKLGAKVNVLLPKNRLYEKHNNLTVQFLPFTPIFPPHIFNFIVLPFLLKTNKQTEFNILRIHNPYFLGIGAFIFKFFFPKTKVVTDILLKEDRVDLHFILNATKSTYDHFFVLTKYLKKWLMDTYGIPSSKISIIYGGVNTYLKPESKSLKLVKKYDLQNKIILLNVGLLIERKNVLFLIDLLERLTKKFDNLLLIYCGKGPLKNKILNLANSKNLTKNIIIIDPIYGIEKTKIYNLADIFLFPTKSEGFGLVAAEAMSCAKPVVASDNSCLAEVVDDNRNGLLAKTSNLNDWVKKVSKLISDKSLRIKMGKNARQKALRQFQWEVVGKKVYKGLFDLI